MLSFQVQTLLWESQGWNEPFVSTESLFPKKESHFQDNQRTNNHESKLEAFFDICPVNLVREVVETDVAIQSLARDGGLL